MLIKLHGGPADGQTVDVDDQQPPRSVCCEQVAPLIGLAIAVAPTAITYWLWYRDTSVGREWLYVAAGEEP